MTQQNVKICLTGGPCAGKTTLQVALTEAFSKYGWRVYRVPEAATILLGGGVNFAAMDAEQTFTFQVNLVRTILQLEATFDDIAAADSKAGLSTVIICDRGVMDANMASAEDWQRLQGEIDGQLDLSRDLRYDLVLHLRTAADGAESYYTSNHARKESPQHARLLDQAILDAWTGHPSLSIIGNEQQLTGAGDSFKTKMDRACQAALARFGLVDRCGSFRRVRYCFIPKNAANFIDDSICNIFCVEYWLLLPSSKVLQMRLRQRTDERSQMIYTLATRRRTEDCDSQGFLETRRNLPEREFLDLLQERINQEPVRVILRTFVWENLQYKLDYFKHPRPGLILLEAYGCNSGLPPFLGGTFEDVTDDPDYSLTAMVQEIIH